MSILLEFPNVWMYPLQKTERKHTALHDSTHPNDWTTLELQEQNLPPPAHNVPWRWWWWESERKKRDCSQSTQAAVSKVQFHRPVCVGSVVIRHNAESPALLLPSKIVHRSSIVLVVTKCQQMCVEICVCIWSNRAVSLKIDTHELKPQRVMLVVLPSEILQPVFPVFYNSISTQSNCVRPSLFRWPLWCSNI